MPAPCRCSGRLALQHGPQRYSRLGWHQHRLRRRCLPIRLPRRDAAVQCAALALGPSASAHEQQPLARAGLELIWERLQGVTELSQPFRCRDHWWNQILGEIRVSKLSPDSWAFLHKKPTTVPGSWLQNHAQCGRAACEALAGEESSRILQLECQICRDERQARARVRTDAQLDELYSAEFEDIPCAVPNNDLRYEINKHRARLFAARHRYQLLWCHARDHVRGDALREDPSLLLKKKDWLRRHDRQ